LEFDSSEIHSATQNSDAPSSFQL